MYLSKKKKIIAPDIKSTVIGTRGITSIPFGTKTKATAAIIIPPPNAIEV